MALFMADTPAVPEARASRSLARVILVAIAGTSAPFLGGGWSTD
jgi:hypothetical protein